jgi:hypothetical protein
MEPDDVAPGGASRSRQRRRLLVLGCVVAASSVGGLAAWGAWAWWSGQQDPPARAVPPRNAEQLRVMVGRLRSFEPGLRRLGHVAGATSVDVARTSSCWLGYDSGEQHVTDPGIEVDWTIAPDRSLGAAARSAMELLRRSGWTVASDPDEFGQVAVRRTFDGWSASGTLTVETFFRRSVYLGLSIDMHSPCPASDRPPRR